MNGSAFILPVSFYASVKQHFHSTMPFVCLQDILAIYFAFDFRKRKLCNHSMEAWEQKNLRLNCSCPYSIQVYFNNFTDSTKLDQGKKFYIQHYCQGPALTIFLHQSEGLCIPAVIDMGWLDIEVPVDTQRLLTWVWPQTPQDDRGQRDLLPRRKLHVQNVQHNDYSCGEMP